MSSLMQSIFGGSSANQSTQSTSTPINFTDPSLKALAPDLAGFLKSLTGSLTTQTNTANPNGGATPVPQAPVTGQEGDLLKTINSQVGPGTASSSWINDVLQGKYMPGGEMGNKNIGGTINAALRPTMDMLTNTLTQALPGRFAAAGQQLQPNSPGSGGGSSAFDNAAALAFQSANHTATDIASNIGNNAYNTGAGQQTQAAGLDQAEVGHTIDALQASALPRLIQQNGINQGLQLFQTQVSNLLDVLKTIGAVQAPVIANQSQSTGTASSSSSKGIIPDLFPKGFSGGS